MPYLATALAGAAVAAGAASVAHNRYRRDAAAAEAAWSDLLAMRPDSGGRYDPTMIAHLPAVAQRYFAHSIASGAPLHAAVELDMRGRFGLGDKRRHRIVPMHARELLVPPRGFVWKAEMGAAPMRLSGSDGYVDGRAWTRFWLLQTVPLIRRSATSDLARAAAVRAVTEAILAPASLLPGNGARWEPVADDSAKVSFDVGGEPVGMTVTFAADGRPQTLAAMRWSDANPEKRFRWQPFGGNIEAVGEFDGFTIPTRIEVGNHYGTDDYFPFFQAEIVAARFR